MPVGEATSSPAARYCPDSKFSLRNRELTAEHYRCAHSTPMAKARDDKHRYGQHYTPRDVARLLAAFAVRSSNDLVFDPSCGDGRLLEEALKLKRQLRTRHRSSDSVLSGEVFGVERSASAVRTARRTGACVAVADFFDIEPGATLNKSTLFPDALDAIIGNPPYIRHEVVGSQDKRRIEARLALDRAGSPDVFWPSWSGRSDIYVYFFAHSIRFLKEHGRLVFLTASSWLEAGYGAALREFLLKNFRVTAIVESSRESFFEDASINTAITVLQREPDAAHREANPIRFVQLREPLARIFNGSAKASVATRRSAVEFATSIEETFVSETFDTHRIRVVHQAELSVTGDRPPAIAVPWGRYLRADEVFFKVIARGRSRLQSLSKIASVRFGVKTGANEFFYVTGEGQPGLLALADVASVRRGITTGANEFFYLSRAAPPTGAEELAGGRRRSQAKGSANGLTVVRDSAGVLREIESELLSRVVFSLKEIRGVLLDRVESQRMLFNCSLASDDLSGTHALEYIQSGELAGYDRRPTCASRDSWYSVARDRWPAPVVFPSKVGERWVVALNRAGVLEDKKLYGIFPNKGVSELALAALLNSTWARYYAEVTCRQMTGAQAIADIDVAVAEQIMIPDPRELSPGIKKKLEAALVELSRRPVGSVFEEVKLADRRRLDSLTLEAIGFGNKSGREEVLDQLYAAVTELVRTRLSRSRDQ
jgi:methylase of polypeptide subunit release factors